MLPIQWGMSWSIYLRLQSIPHLILTDTFTLLYLFVFHNMCHFLPIPFEKILYWSVQLLDWKLHKGRDYWYFSHWYSLRTYNHGWKRNFLKKKKCQMNGNLKQDAQTLYLLLFLFCMFLLLLSTNLSNYVQLV